MLRSKFAKPLAIWLLCAAFGATGAERAQQDVESSGRCSAPAETAAPPPASAVDLPSYGSEDDTGAQAAGRQFFGAWSSYRNTLIALLGASGDPRDLAASALVASMNFGSPHLNAESQASLARAIAAAPDDVLVQWIALQVSRLAQLPHAKIALTRLQHLEPDNGAVWLETLNQLPKPADSAAVDATLARLATSSRFDLHVGEMSKLMLDAFGRVPSNDIAEAFRQVGGDDQPSRLNVPALLALGTSSTAAIPAYQDLVHACKDDAEQNPGRRADCTTIGHLMATRGDTGIANRIGYALLRVTQTFTDDDVRAARQDDWLDSQSTKALQIADSHTGADVMLDMQQTWARLGSERAATFDTVQRAGLPLTPPDDWTDEDSPFSAEHQKRDATIVLP